MSPATRTTRCLQVEDLFSADDAQEPEPETYWQAMGCWMIGTMADRPKNETAQTLKTEDEARTVIETKWKCEVIKLQPAVYGVDWAVFKSEKLHSWGEFKRRFHEFGQYPTLDIGLGKWMRLKWNAERSRVPFAIYVEWNDGLRFCSWPHHSGMEYTAGVLRREDRGQAGDVEPCVKIPVSEFKAI